MEQRDGNGSSHGSGSERLRRLFDGALERSGAERTAFVAQHTEGEPELCRELEELLRHAEIVGDFLAAPVRARRASPTPAHGLPPFLHPGERLGDHEILAFLASGGGGQVYRARQLSLGRQVALKVVATATLTDTDRERFLRGARLAAEIHHPHLVEVYESGEDPARGLLHYSMRLVEGDSLEACLTARGAEPRAITVEERRALVERFHEVASALAALHERGVIHRDVKPANILVEGAPRAGSWDGRAVVVDYGLVTQLEASTHSTAMGTLPYAAPELFLEGRTDERADVYGLGLCLYDFLSTATRRAGPARELPRLRDVAPEVDLDLEAIVQRCIERSPEERYANGAELARDLAAWLAGRPVRARRLTRLERGRRFVRRHPDQVLRWALRAGAAVVVLALAIGGPRAWLGLRAHAARAEAAWGDGDLLEARRAADRLPSSLRSLFPGSSLARPPDPSEPSAKAIEDVLREGEQRGEAAALLLAARYLQRDGLAAHRDLGRFLVHGLGTGELAPAALRITARLFFDRPVESVGDLREAEPFRARLTELLGDPRITSADFLYGLAALGGCGDAGSCATITAALEERSRDESAQGREELRVGLRALDFIVRRSSATGESAVLAGQAWDSRFRSLAEALERSRAWSGPDYGVSDALDCLLLAAAQRRREEGVEPLGFEPPVSMGEWPQRPFFRAVNRDPELLGLREACGLFRALLPRSGNAHRTTCDQVRVAGAALVALGEPFTVEERGAALVPFTDDDMCLGDALKCLEDGLLRGQDEQHGFPDEWRPDLDTRLGQWFEEQYAPWVRARRDADAGPSSRVLARWEFRGVEPSLTLAATGLDRRCSPILPDAGIGFVRLGIAGLSEVQLRFRTVPDERSKMLVFRLKYQKARRAHLPYCGEAAVVVSFEDQVQRVPAGDESPYDVDLQLFPRRVGADGEHVVSVRLEDSSTTTFRIYRAEVLDLNSAPLPDMTRLSARDAPDEKDE